jgi:hypothetical protein
MSPAFESVRDQLLRAGIAPRHVRRYVVELREHLADLAARERNAGLDAKAAEERARAVLGTDAQLVQSMIDRAPRSLAARAPWAIFALLPVVIFVTVLASIDDSMMHLLRPLATGPGRAPTTYNVLIAAASFVADYLLGPVLAAGCVALALRQRLSSRWVWIGLGLIALISGMFGFYMNVLPRLGGLPGGAVFSAVPNVWMNGRVNGTATLAVVILRAGVLFTLAGIAFRAIQSHRDATVG